MEKRTIIAFVLSFLVLFGWQFLFSPKQKPVAPVEEVIQETGAKQTQEPAQSISSHLVGTKAVREIDQDMSTLINEKEVKVETPLYSIVFSNKGAAINSVMLNNYRQTADAASPPVELVKIEDDAHDFLKLSFEEQGPSGDETITYDVNDDHISLGPDSAPRNLIFKGVRSDGVIVMQTFTFYPDKYDIRLNLTIQNDSAYTIGGNIKAYLSNQPPEKKKGYYSFNGFALFLNNKLETLKADKLKEEKSFSGRIDWIAFEDDYFISAVIPEGVNEGIFTGKTLNSGLIQAVYIAPSTDLNPVSGISSEFTLYMGPRDLSILSQQGKSLDKAINYGWFDVIAKPLHFVLQFFYKHIHNYGVAIILLTILIKIIFWPLTHKSYKSMKEMQKLQPLMAKIREKYKDNKEQMQRELMGLYKTYKVNPMGGCLPMVIQIPVFFALFRILGNSIELRHAPFFLWINDLSAPDRLFSFPFQIPFMTAPYGIPVLTLLMGVSMFIQQKMTPTAGDPSQAKIMLFLPIIFTAMFINFPSGLVLYWLVNNILSIGQQYRIKKMI
jgi:YidC/Oxa1 family membrane protein insertase